MKKILWVAMLLVLVASVAFAVGNKNDLAYLGLDELDSATAITVTDEVLISQSGIPKQGATVSDLSKVKVASVEVHNTTDMSVVLATETGKTFIATQNTKFQLPTAADGLVYTFVTGAATELEIQIATTPGSIIFMHDAVGRGVIETGPTNTTGNSVTLASDGTNWYAVASTGTWETGGAWTVLDMGAQA